MSSVAAHAQSGLRAPSPTPGQHKRVAAVLASLEMRAAGRAITLNTVARHPDIGKPVPPANIKVIMLRMGWRSTTELRWHTEFGRDMPARVWRPAVAPFPDYQP